MKYLSLCSGIEAASVAWKPLGWEPAAFSEIEKFPNAVLQHHYPDVPNLGDMTRYGEWPDLRPDLVVGGTPCQSFSVAGLRAGLADPRGNLALVFLGVVDRYRPRWIVWENVPGVRSSSDGRDFGAFLGGLAELGYGVAWRSLDSQYFGLAQRRERVFVVGYRGDWRLPVAVLLEPESLCGHPAPRREAGEGTPHDVASSLSASGRGFERAGETRGQDPVIAYAPEVSPAMKQRDHKGPSSDGDGDGLPLIAVTHALRAAHMAVRRLTPRECERLQGFPDDYTLIPYRGKPAADGPRYKSLGNSMAVPVVRWIGKRIQHAEGGLV